MKKENLLIVSPQDYFKSTTINNFELVELQKEIFKDTFATLCLKIGGIIANGTDSIIISSYRYEKPTSYEKNVLFRDI